MFFEQKPKCQNRFNNLSLTLPKEKIFLTQKIRKKEFHTNCKQSAQSNQKKSCLNEEQIQVSLLTKKQKKYSLNNRDNQQLLRSQYNKEHYEYQKMELQEKLNQKNQLLMKQSQIKNYFLKQQIWILLQQILDYLTLLRLQLSQQFQIQTLYQNLKSAISKVEVLKQSEHKWIQFIDFDSLNNKSNAIKSNSFHSTQVQTQNEQKPSSIYFQSIQKKNIKEQNHRVKFQDQNVISTLTIITEQLSIKQKQIQTLKQKYFKVKDKKFKLQNQFNSLNQKFESILNQKNKNKSNFSKRQESSVFNSKLYHRHQLKHNYNYSLDKNFSKHKKSNFQFSEYDKEKISEEQQKLFTLSDTPLLGTKAKDLPAAMGFIDAKRKIIESKYSHKKESSLNSRILDLQNALRQQVQVQQFKQNRYLEMYQNIEQSNKQSQARDSQQFQLTKFLLCQSLTIQKLLQKIS